MTDSHSSISKGNFLRFGFTAFSLGVALAFWFDKEVSHSQAKKDCGVYAQGGDTSGIDPIKDAARKVGAGFEAEQPAQKENAEYRAWSVNGPVKPIERASVAERQGEYPADGGNADRDSQFHAAILTNFKGESI